MSLYSIRQNQTARPLLFLMVDSTDHITGKTGLTPTVTISKNGGSFGAPAGAITEIGHGWYKVAGNATDANTLGPLILRATAAGADPSDTVYEVVAFDPEDTIRLGLTALPFAAAGASGGLPTVDANNAVKLQSGTGANQISLASGAVTVGTNNDKTGYGLSATAVQAIWDALTSALTTAGSIGKLLVDRIDAAISSRSSHTAADVWSVGTRGLTEPVTVGTNNDKTGYSLSSAERNQIVSQTSEAVWDRPRAAHTTTGSFGEGVASVQGDLIGDVLGDVQGSVASVLDRTGYELDPSEHTAIADSLLDRDMSVGVDSGTESIRTVRQALRALRNRFSISGITRTVYKEDDTTPSWTSKVQTDADALPIVGDDPTGP